jgi:glycerol kinase
MRWSARLTELFEVPLQALPDCVPVLNNLDTAHGKLAGTEIPVHAIIGDQNAAFFGTGRLTPETALINFGSGAFVLSPLTHYQSSDRQLCTIACSENSTVQYVREATINGAGSALSWLAKKHNAKDLWEQLPAWLNVIEHPPVFINTIGGLGSPWWNNDIEAVFLTLPSSNDISAQAVGIIESIVFMVCANLEIIQNEHTLDRLRVCGGLSQLDGLCQRLANLSGLPVQRAEAPEATARGTAWLAAGKPDSWAPVELETFKPQNATSLQERYSMFNTALQNLA